MVLSVGLLLFVWAAGVVLGAGVARFKATCQKEQVTDVFVAAGLLPVPVCFHVLPGKVGELVGKLVCGGSRDLGGDVAGGFDDCCGVEHYGEWCVGVKRGVRLVVEEGEECNEQGQEEAGCGKDADEVHPVHVFVAVCPQLDELRRQAGREVKEYPGYADGGCELFVGEEFFEFTAKGVECFHGGSVTDLG